MSRTVSDSTITQALIDEQNGARVPHIRIFIDSVDYSDRVEYLEYHNEAYRERAIIGLQNRDGALDSLDVDGQEFEIALGYVTGNNVAEPLGNGADTEYVYYPTLWVKSHQVISAEGERIYQIFAEGMWMYLRERKVIAGVNIWQASRIYLVGEVSGAITPNGHSFIVTVGGTSGGTEPSWNVASNSTTSDGTVTWVENGIALPYSNVFNRTHTVYGLFKLLIEGALGWILEPLSGVDDGIIDSYKPVFEINQMPFENAAALLYRLIWMTKGYLRPKKSKTFQFVFPQDGDSVTKTYYSDQDHWFIEYVEKTILLIPNSIIVLSNQDPNGQWGTEAFPLIVGTASDATQIAKYDGGNEVQQVFFAGSIQSQANSDLRAEAILTRMKAEILGGRLIIPFDAQLELYDKVSIQDGRNG